MNKPPVITKEQLDTATRQFLLYHRRAQVDDEQVVGICKVLVQDGPFKLLVHELCKTMDERPDETGAVHSMLLVCVFQIGFLAGHNQADELWAARTKAKKKG